MTSSRTENITAVAGSADGVATQAELRAGVADGQHPERNNNLSTLASNVSRALDWSVSSESNLTDSPKYPVNPDNSYYGAGAFSLNPLLGRFIFGNAENEETVPALKIDKSESTLTSTGHGTTLGSKNIDTTDGYELNKEGASIPSSSFSPKKTWVKNIFSTLTDKKLIQIAFLEAIQVLLLKSVKGTKSEQIVKEKKNDLGTIIINNKTIEDKILTDFYARRASKQ